MNFIDATETVSGCMLYLGVDFRFFLACDLKTRAVYGRFDGEWWSS